MNSRIVLIMVIAVVALASGWWGRGMVLSQHATDSGADSTASDGPCPRDAQPLYWKAPMDPSYVREAPGKSPMGMDLVPECPSVANSAPEGAVVIDAATVQNIGVRTAPVERREPSVESPTTSDESFTSTLRSKAGSRISPSTLLAKK